MSRDVLERIREACAAVVARARCVRIDAARLRALAADLARTPAPASHLDPAHQDLGGEAATLAYVVTLDAINFGSGWFPHLRKRDGLSGYFTIAGGLRERFERKGAWSAAELCALGADELALLFGQDPRLPEAAELMGLFARALHELGAFLTEHYAGRFAGPIEEAAGSAARLVEILARMPLYRDVARYDGLEVPFFKRAQLTAADLAAAFRGEGPGRFRDLDRLTLFADNLVPHVLRREGVLRYDEDLARRIDAGALIASGSPEEVEIRAAAVHAVELCVAEIRGGGGSATAHGLDFVLWNRGQRPEVKAHPRHRTRTTYY
jgi:hypothetical protein